MRWKIKSIDTKINEEEGKKITTTTKQLMVSIGDIVGVGKNAYGAIAAACNTLPAMARDFPNSGLSPYVSSLSVLGTVVKGLDVYKKVTSVIEKVTPLVQTIARASGAWSSPGNVGDIAQIVWGQAQKALISLAISAILKLKEIIWNYEFSLKEISSDLEQLINKNLDSLKLPEINFTGDNEESGETGTGGEGGGDTGNTNIPETDYYEIYRTKYKKSQYERLLRGSKINKGIEYSDDNGETWELTKQTTGSWKNFAKLESNNGYIYVSGGVNYIKTLKLTEDKKIELKKNYYYKDEATEQIIEYTYDQKKTLELKNAYEIDEYKPSLGIYYSRDNGYSWEKANFNNKTKFKENECIRYLCEFDEKQGENDVPIKATIVALSNDFNGVIYTLDGNNWEQSISEGTMQTDGKWIIAKPFKDDFKIINNIGISSEFTINKTKAYSGRVVNKNNIYQRFGIGKMKVEVAKKNGE